MALWQELFSLQGETISLVPIEEHHFEELWEAADSPEIWTYTATKIQTKEDLRRTIQTAINKRNNGLEYTFVVMDQNKKSVGCTSFLDIKEENNSLEIGSTWYNPKVWRTRANTECKFLLLHHAFDSWKMRRVQLKTDSRNLRSQAAIERIGAKKEGILRKDRVISDGYVRDTVFYSILQDEWPEVKERLLVKLSR